MSRMSRNNVFFILSVFLGLTLVMDLHPLPASANGDDGHHKKKEKDDHMQAMRNVKENIPEEYRIMDRTPVAPSEKSLETGRKLFLQNCAVCHGENGDGRGPAAAGMKTKPANFLDLEHSSMYGPGEKYWIIENGLPDMGMAGFGGQMSPYDSWSLVNHIHRLQENTELESLFPKKEKHSH